MGEPNSELEWLESSLNQLARKELNKYLKSEVKSPGNEKRILHEHLQNNIFIEELYQSVSEEMNKYEKAYEGKR